MSHATLQEIAEIRAGYPFRGVVRDDPDGDTAVIQLKNVDELMGIRWNEVVRTDLPGRRQPTPLVQGDILFAARGHRNFAVAMEKPEKRTVCTPHFFQVHIRQDEPVLPEYLSWFINQAPAKNYFMKTAEGSAVRSIRRDVLGKLQVAIPPLEEQHTIVQLMESMKKEQRLIEQLQHNSRQIMHAIANRFLTEA